MKFLIKDLSRLTGISPARIRKWQERYNLLQPEQARNGYWYYSNDDYIILKNLKTRLDRGERLKHLVSEGKAALLNPAGDLLFSEEEWHIIRALQSSDFILIRSTFEAQRQRLPFPVWIRRVIWPSVVMIGRAWEQGIISVGDEHTFSRWLMGYLMGIAEHYRIQTRPIWLVTVFPGDLHEIGALMHYLLLLKHKVAARFVGTLPEEILLKEIAMNRYRAVSISMVMPQKPEDIKRLEHLLRSATEVEKIFFGGFGLSYTRKTR